MVHFRVGPARLFQFRDECNFYNNSWNEQEVEPEAWKFQSPLMRPWFHNNNTRYPDDWISKTPEVDNNFPSCGYEAEMGTTLATSNMILNNLYENNWLGMD